MAALPALYTDTNLVATPYPIAAQKWVCIRPLYDKAYPAYPQLPKMPDYLPKTGPELYNVYYFRWFFVQENVTYINQLLNRIRAMKSVLDQINAKAQQLQSSMTQLQQSGSQSTQRLNQERAERVAKETLCATQATKIAELERLMQQDDQIRNQLTQQIAQAEAAKNAEEARNARTMQAVAVKDAELAAMVLQEREQSQIIVGLKGERDALKARIDGFTRTVAELQQRASEVEKARSHSQLANLNRRAAQDSDTESGYDTDPGYAPPGAGLIDGYFNDED